MTVWFSADLHVGHRNISRYCGRPFPDTDDGVHEMDAALIARWNEVVAPDDVVWVLGDVALGPIERSLERVAQLQATKALIAGNHDRCWDGHDDPAKVAEWRDRYHQAGFATIDDWAELELDGRTVRLSHFPYRGDSHAEDRFESHRPTDDGTWLLHGHVHDTWRQQGPQINVGVDAWGGRPVAAAEVIALLDAGPRDLPPLPWDRS
ncbi:MAG: metallophosphoesterase [Iamia sp.]